MGAGVVVEGFGSLTECLGVWECWRALKGPLGGVEVLWGGWLLRRLKKI